MHTRALAVYIGLGRYTPMHSSAHGGLTRSGSMFSRLTFHYLNVFICVCRCHKVLGSLMICKSRNLCCFLAGNMQFLLPPLYSTSFFVSGHFHSSLHVYHLPMVVGDLTGRGPAAGVTYIPHPFSVSKQLTRLLSSPKQAEGAPSLLQSKFTRKWNPLYAKQTMRRK